MKKFYNFYKVSKKLRLLMVLEILLLTVSFILILFFYMQNYTTQQSNTIYHMNQSLLIQTNSVIEKMDNSLDFPLAHIADRYDDPLLRYLIEHDHGDISETDFYRVFAMRVSEVSIQIPDLESLFLFDTDGNLLNGKIIYNRYIPLKNYSDVDNRQVSAIFVLWQTGMVSSRNFSKSMICIYTYRKELFRKTDRLQVSLWRRRCSPPSPDGLCVQILP